MTCCARSAAIVHRRRRVRQVRSGQRRQRNARLQRPSRSSIEARSRWRAPGRLRLNWQCRTADRAGLEVDGTVRPIARSAWPSFVIVVFPSGSDESKRRSNRPSSASGRGAPSRHGSASRCPTPARASSRSPDALPCVRRMTPLSDALAPPVVASTATVFPLTGPASARRCRSALRPDSGLCSFPTRSVTREPRLIESSSGPARPAHAQIRRHCPLRRRHRAPARGRRRHVIRHDRHPFFSSASEWRRRYAQHRTRVGGSRWSRAPPQLAGSAFEIPV